MFTGLKKRFPLLVLELLTLLLFLWLQTTSQPFIKSTREQIENLAYDFTIKNLVRKSSLPSPVIVVDIDEKSLAIEGRWPWSRIKIAALVQQLRKLGTTVVAFDMVFSQPEKNIAITFLQKLQEVSNDNPAVKSAIQKNIALFDADTILADSLQKSDHVLGFIFDNNIDVPSTGKLPAPLLTLEPSAAKQFVVPTMPRYRGNMPLFQDIAKYGGFMTTIPDADGILRRSPLIIRYDTNIYPSLALEAVRVYLLLDRVDIETTLIGNLHIIEAIKLGSTRIVTDALGQVLIPYFNPVTAASSFSATDILHGKIKLNALQNTIALIGTSALGMSDLHATPVQASYPGLHIQANIARSLLANRFHSKPIWSGTFEFLLSLIAGLIIIILSLYRSPIILLLTALILNTLLFGIDIWLLNVKHFVLSIVMTLLLIFTLTVFDIWYGFIFEYRKRKQLKMIFGQYIPPTRVEMMSEGAEKINLEGESKELTILFADIVNFTQMSEKLPANTVKKLLNLYLTPMTEVIFENKGTIDKYVGDMIMAFWGAPISDPDHVKNALTTALAMKNRSIELRKEFDKNNLPHIDMGIGVNTGTVNVGDMGSKFRVAYTVLGDAVNLGSRIELLTRHYDIGIAVGEASRKGQDSFIFRTIDRVRVKGKQEVVTIYELLCEKNKATEKLLTQLQQHEVALAHYFNQEWDEAYQLFLQLRDQYPDIYLYKLYLDRVKKLREHPPKDWDGIYQWKTK